MSSRRFIEVTVKDHVILHGFDPDNKEIMETVTLDEPMRKLIAVDRIQSLTAKFMLTTYGHGRWIYWQYLESYDELKERLLAE